MASNPPSHTDPSPFPGADTLSKANLSTKSSSNQLSEAPQGVAMSIEPRQSDIKNKADILFQKKIKAAKDQITAMKKWLEQDEKRLAIDEANLKLVNGYRYFGETRVGGIDVGARVGILEENLQYRAVRKGVSPEVMVNRERLDVQRLKSDIRVKEWKLEREISNYHSGAEKSVEKSRSGKQDEGLASTEDLRSNLGTAEEFDGLIGEML